MCVGVGDGQGECVGVGVRVEGGCRRGGGGACQIGVGVGVSPTHPFGISLSTVTIGALSAAYTKFPLSRSYVSPRLLSFRPLCPCNPYQHPAASHRPSPLTAHPQHKRQREPAFPPPRGGGIKGGRGKCLSTHPPRAGPGDLLSGDRFLRMGV